MSHTAHPETADFQTIGNLQLRPQERYEELDFARRARLPELDDAEMGDVDYPPAVAIHSLVRRMYHAAIALFAIAVAVATLAHRPLLAIAMAFGALAIYSFANYTADRLGADTWRIPAAVALRLTIAAAFLCVTALLAALLH